MRTLLAPMIAALALTGCSVLPESRGGPAAERTSAGQRGAARPAAAPLPASPAERQCLTDLGGTGARFTPLPDQRDGPGCTNLNTVQLTALRSDDDELAIANIGPVTCPVSQAFAAWARFGVDRAARQVLGSPLARIETYGSYACRNVAGTGRRSAHATASAIDVAGFVLENGQRISVRSGWNGDERERRFLRVVHESACKRFRTVLGPEYDAAHRDHFHMEGVIEGRSYCR